MADPAQRRRHPVFAGDALLGWVWVWEPPALIDQKYASGTFDPGPDFEPHRALFEDVMALAHAVDAWAGDDPEAEKALEYRCWDRTREIADLDLTVGEDRYPVDDVGLFPGWHLTLYPPSGGFRSLAVDPAKVKPEVWNLSPVPSHLAGWVGPAEINGDRVTAAVRCPCGNERLAFHYVGVAETPGGEVVPKVVEVDGVDFFLVRCVCDACGRGHVLFDTLRHGHDGFLYHRPAKAALPRPPQHVWRCPKCGSAAHRGTVTVVSDFKDRYFEEGYARKCGFERWPDAYGCFALSVTCCGCGLKATGWIDYECR